MARTAQEPTEHVARKFQFIDALKELARAHHGTQYDSMEWATAYEVERKNDLVGYVIKQIAQVGVKGTGMASRYGGHWIPYQTRPRTEWLVMSAKGEIWFSYETTRDAAIGRLFLGTA